jgi:hypothetical protein
MSIHTAYQFRQYDGNGKLLWASGINEGDDGNPMASEGIYRGSEGELEVIRAQPLLLNTLADEGEGDILDVYFDVQAVRTNLYCALFNDTPLETDSMTDLVDEEAGSGYARATFARGTDWGIPALDGGDMMTTSTTKTFTATGAWSANTYAVLTTDLTGTAGLLIAYVALSATRTLANTETLDVSFTVKLA